MKHLNCLVSAIWFITAFIVGCSNNNILNVDGGGVGVEGHVFSGKDSIHLDSVRITFTSFEGSNLQGVWKDFVFYSDTAGYFNELVGAGYSIKNGEDINRVRKCNVIFSKQGYLDTTFSIDNSAPSGSFVNIKIYLKASNN